MVTFPRNSRAHATSLTFPRSRRSDQAGLLGFRLTQHSFMLLHQCDPRCSHRHHLARGHLRPLLTPAPAPAPRPPTYHNPNPTVHPLYLSQQHVYTPQYDRMLVFSIPTISFAVAISSPTPSPSHYSDNHEWVPSQHMTHSQNTNTYTSVTSRTSPSSGSSSYTSSI